MNLMNLLYSCLTLYDMEIAVSSLVFLLLLLSLTLVDQAMTILCLLQRGWCKSDANMGDLSLNPPSSKSFSNLAAGRWGLWWL